MMVQAAKVTGFHGTKRNQSLYYLHIYFFIISSFIHSFIHFSLPSINPQETEKPTGYRTSEYTYRINKNVKKKMEMVLS
jgi:hypothetical protein